MMPPPDSEFITFFDRPLQIVRKYRARRLTISIRADRPMRLTSSRTTTSAEIMRFLNAHASWIQKTIAKIESVEKRYQKPKLESGALFPFLGELKYFSFAASKSRRPKFAVEDGFLIGYLPAGKTAADFSSADLERTLHQFFKKQGVDYIKARMQFWIYATGLVPTQLKFGRATTRWGSCNSKKQIGMNWKLICHAPHLIDYVIVHELCHLRYLNHSDHFWNLVAQFMPEYPTYEKTLNEETHLSRFLNAATSS